MGMYGWLETLDYSTKKSRPMLRKYEKAKGFQAYSCNIEPGGRVLHEENGEISVISSIHKKEFKQAIANITL